MAARKSRAALTIEPNRTPVPPGSEIPAGADGGGLELEPEDSESYDDAVAGEPDDLISFGVQALRAANETGDMTVLSDARFADWSWHIFRLRSADEPANRESGGSPRIWCDKQVGPLDLSLIKSRHGGGVFEIWCKDPRGVLRRKFRQEIAGPRMRYTTVEPAPSSPPPVSTSNDPVIRLLERQGQILEQLVRERAPRVKEQSPLEVLDIAARIASMSNPGPQQSATDLLAVLKEGMALQAQVAGGGDSSSTAEKLLEKSLPVIERVLAQLLAPRRQAAGRPQPRPNPPATAVPVTESSATVVEEPQPIEEPVQENHRMVTAVEACARSLAQGQPPEDFAVTLENILNEQELGLVRMATPAMLLEQMRANAGGKFPILEHENAEGFIAGVLAELNRPPTD